MSEYLYGLPQEKTGGNRRENLGGLCDVIFAAALPWGKRGSRRHLMLAGRILRRRVSGTTHLYGCMPRMRLAKVLPVPPLQKKTRLIRNLGRFAGKASIPYTAPFFSSTTSPSLPETRCRAHCGPVHDPAGCFLPRAGPGPSNTGPEHRSRESPWPAVPPFHTGKYPSETFAHLFPMFTRCFPVPFPRPALVPCPTPPNDFPPRFFANAP